MAIGAPQVGTDSEFASAASSALPYPATVNANDLLVLMYAANSATAITLPAGWTQVARLQSTGNTAAPGILLAIKFAAGTEGGTNLTVTHPSVVTRGQILAFPGVDQGTPQDATATTVDSSAGAQALCVIPAITVVTAGTTLVAIAASNTLTQSATPPTSFTETGDHISSGSGEWSYLQAVGTGSTGTKTVTFSGAGKQVGAMLALRAAKTATGTGSASFTLTAASTGRKNGAGTGAPSFTVSTASTGLKNGAGVGAPSFTLGLNDTGKKGGLGTGTAACTIGSSNTGAKNGQGTSACGFTLVATSTGSQSGGSPPPVDTASGIIAASIALENWHRTRPRRPHAAGKGTATHHLEATGTGHKGAATATTLAQPALHTRSQGHRNGAGTGLAALRTETRTRPARGHKGALGAAMTRSRPSAATSTGHGTVRKRHRDDHELVQLDVI